jgi:hypothetical protein
MDASALVSAGAGLLGVIVGGALTAYTQWRGRVNERHRDQLQNFYSPLLGLREQIRAKSELRTRLYSVAGAQFPNIARTASEDEKEAYTSILEYSEKQLKEELVPAYEQMVTLFTDKMHLAEPSSRHRPRHVPHRRDSAGTGEAGQRPGGAYRQRHGGIRQFGT